MERFRVIGSVDNFDGQQNLDEWVLMIERAAEFAGWGPDQSFKAAMFRLRGEAGEYAEQLKDEGKLTTWKELKEALKERYDTAGKEQWHQYLLNTATQGSSTVQEWAQTVRKVSLLALKSEGIGLRRNQEGNQAEGGSEDVVETGGAQTEAKKKLLDFMRKSNFIRGLRSSLRQMVWRKKCATFDDAVRVAAEEEAVESSHREEEVLSCYKRDLPKLAEPGLVDQIVAALEIREEAKHKNQERTRQVEERTAKAGSKNLRDGNSAPGRRMGQDDGFLQSGHEEDGNDGMHPAIGQSFFPNQPVRPPFQRQETQQYGGQLPLPRGGYASRGPGRKMEWTRQGWPEQRWQTRGNREMYCYSCGGRGHMRRQCPSSEFQQPGNDYRRLQ